MVFGEIIFLQKATQFLVGKIFKKNSCFNKNEMKNDIKNLIFKEKLVLKVTTKKINSYIFSYISISS